MTHFVEIDLLRGGEALPMIHVPASNYPILISRSPQRPKAQLYAFNLKQSIQVLTIPLRTREEEPLLNIQPLLHRIYDRARLELAIDYAQRCIPKLSKEDQVWAQTYLNEQQFSPV